MAAEPWPTIAVRASLHDRRMRLALKITLAVTAWTLLVLLVGGQLRLQRELELFDADMRQDSELLGAVLRAAVQDAHASGGWAAVDDLILDANASEHVVRIRLVRDAAELAPLEPAERHALTDGQLVVLDREPSQMVTLVPVRGDLGVLELSRSLQAKHDYVRDSRLELGASLAIIVVCSAVVAVALGWWLVGRRVNVLVRAARELGRGESVHPPTDRRRDELGQLTTELRAMATALEQARERVEHQVAERDRAVQRLRHADRLATMGALLSRVAHEVGTPLNVIGARARMIVAGDAGPERSLKNAGIIVEQSDRITTIIRNLLDFSRSDQGHRGSCSVRPVIEQTVALLGTLARDRGVSIEVAGGEDVVVHGDRSQICQALTNLLVNAVHAESGATVRVDVGYENGRAPLSEGGHEGRWARISVTDEGPGVPPDLRDRIFEPFVTTKERGEGTGLGLSIAAEIIHEHGGWIAADFERPHGSRFTIHLPLPVSA